MHNLVFVPSEDVLAEAYATEQGLLLTHRDFGQAGHYLGWRKRCRRRRRRRTMVRWCCQEVGEDQAANCCCGGLRASTAAAPLLGCCSAEAGE